MKYFVSKRVAHACEEGQSVSLCGSVTAEASRSVLKRYENWPGRVKKCPKCVGKILEEKLRAGLKKEEAKGRAKDEWKVYL